MNDSIRCTCGETELRHSHDNQWKCEACGRFHDVESLDRLADQTRAIKVNQ